MSDIAFHKVSKRYPDGTGAVHELDLEVHDGEFLVLVGPSGCGKSTALRMAAGLESITSGELLIDGEVVNQLPPKRRDVAMVFQDYALYPQMTVRQNMAFALKLAKVGKADIARKVEQAAAVLDLSGHLDRKPGQLSGGQRQRVAMGRAIVRQPRAFLMDEPLSNLDAKLRWEMRTQIAQLQERLGTTTIFVTHDQTEATTLGHRVAVMRGGVMQQIGAPLDLYREPANLFVADFIGSPPMNLLPGVVQGEQLRTPLGLVTLTPEQRAALVGRASGPVVCGIRPEALEDAAQVGSERNRLGHAVEARVELLELVGAETYASLQLKGDALEAAHAGETTAALQRHVSARAALRGLVTARMGSKRAIAVGDHVGLWFEPRELHLFDPDSGLALRA